MCDMTPENRNSPLLDNGSLNHVTVTMNRHSMIEELFEVVIFIRFAPILKGGHVIDSRVYSSLAIRR
jgi:hypothetical protein